MNLSQLQVQRLSDTGSCVPLATTVDPVLSQVTTQLNHFTVFQLGNVVASNTPDTAIAFPNPFYPTRGQGFMTLASMPSFSHVRIYTLRGELVREDFANGSGVMEWSGINQSNRSVASGVYLVVIESGGKKKILKVVVLR